MGARGPVPKRPEERLGHRAKSEQGLVRPPRPMVEVPRPAPNPSWHHIARSWYLSLGSSGQSLEYEASDWMVAVFLADQMSQHLDEKPLGITKEGEVVWGKAPMSGQEIQAFLKGMTALLATAGDRRRAGAELGRRQADEDEDAQILHLVRDEEEAAFG